VSEGVAKATDKCSAASGGAQLEKVSALQVTRVSSTLHELVLSALMGTLRSHARVFATSTRMQVP
jgi:hypothetical protein